VFGQELGSGQGRQSVNRSLHAAAVFSPKNSESLDRTSSELYGPPYQRAEFDEGGEEL
jgi:hypothetical protein